jgi:hypothetical protein
MGCARRDATTSKESSGRSIEEASSTSNAMLSKPVFRRRETSTMPGAEVLAIRREPDLAKRLMLHAGFSTRTAERIAPFLLMVQAAAGADAAGAMLDEIGRQRLAGMTVMAAESAATRSTRRH